MQALNRLAPLALILAISVPATAQEAIRWQTNLDQAKKIAADTNRLVLVHFWADWCGPCKRLEHSVFNQPAVGAALEASYVPVKLNLDRNRLLAQKYNVRSIPTDVVITPSGQVVGSFVSPQDSQAYIAQVTQIAGAGRSQPGTQLAQRGANGASPYAGIGQPHTTPGNRAPHYQNGTVQNPALAGPAAGARYAQTSYGQQPAAAPQNQYPAGQVAPHGNYAPTAPAAQQPATQGYRPAMPSGGRYAPGAPASPPTHGTIPNHAAQNRYNQGGYAAPQNGVQPPAGVNHTPRNPGYHNDDRYGSVPAQPAGPTQGAYGQPSPPRQTVNPYANPAAPRAQPPVQQPPVQPPVVQQNPYVQQPQQPQKTAAAKPSPYALEGYCPVELMNAQRWTAGDKQFGAVHRGQTFLFTSAENQQKFLADPDRYAPALGGIDPILALENRQTVNGKRRHGVYYRDRIYLFSNEASLARFNQNPGHYAEGVRQALLQQNSAPRR